MKAVLFDLDNTLYPEFEFVKSGFRTVARHLSSRYHFSEDSLFREMLDIMQKDGRGKVFDSLVNRLGLCGEDKAKILVYLYRSHRPRIGLYDDVLPTLDKIRSWGIRLGIVSDGMASVQRNKIAVLGLEKLFDVIVCTDELGREYWKPSIIPYKITLDLLQTSPSDAAYVGDDPSKDFVGANSMGMVTIQVEREIQHSFAPNIVVQHGGADYVVKSLDRILPIIKGGDDVQRKAAD